MRFGSIVSLLFLGLGLGVRSTTATPVETRALSGTLSFLKDQPLMTFKYSTSDVHPKNWIGIYSATGGGPDNEEYVSNSLAWAYTPNGEGTVKISPEKLLPGETYKAYLLAKDKYKWLAEPVVFELPRTVGKIEFLVDKITLRNARQNEAYNATISGLLGGGVDAVKVTYAKVDGAEWIQVSPDGVVHGTPSDNERGNLAGATIEATASDGTTTRLDIAIPIRLAGETLVGEVNVLTHNMWHGGTHVDDYHRKQLRMLAIGDYDIIGLQESAGSHGTRLARALGWYVWQGLDCAVISRYPIVEVYPELYRGGGVKIALDGSKSEIVVWSIHIAWSYYGPYGFCYDGMSTEQVLALEAKSGRTAEIKEIISALDGQLANADNVPVVLMGDFNSPSHQDWTEAAKHLHCGAFDVPWPATVVPTEAGMIDAFRAANPDPVAEPGITWSPIKLDNEGRPEPMDRIDLIFHKGNMTVLESAAVVVGSPHAEPDVKDNEYTSDHGSAHAVFKIPTQGTRPCTPRPAKSSKNML